MSMGTRAHRMGLSISLVAPVAALCEMVALHVRDGVALLGVGGCTVGEWLGVVCPHDVEGGWLHAVWRDGEGAGISVRFRLGPGGSVLLDGVDWGVDHGLAVALQGMGSEPLGVVTVVASGWVDYGVGDAVRWVRSHGDGEGLRLGRGGGRLESEVDVLDVGDVDVALMMVSCEFEDDPERN